MTQSTSLDARFEKLAGALADAWRTGRTIPLPAAADAPKSRADAYAIQDRMAALIGGKVVGWKVGATVRAVQVFEGHDGPLPGRVFADRAFESPAEIPSSLLFSAKVECEFAFRLTADLAPSTMPITSDALADKVVFHPAIEIAATRYQPGTGERGSTTYDGIADNGTSGAVVLGPAIADWRNLPFETMEIDGRIDDSPPIQAYSGPYRRHPLDITAETFTDLQRRGVALPAGAFLLTGSLTLPTAIRKGQRMTARFGSLANLSLTMV